MALTLAKAMVLLRSAEVRMPVPEDRPLRGEHASNRRVPDVRRLTCTRRRF